MIRTILGDISPQALGHCQCHEHLFIAKGKSYEINPVLWMEDENAALIELILYSEAGGTTIVDAQPTGCGSMPQLLMNTSIFTKVNIIASCGFHKLCFYPENHWILRLHSEKLAEYFVMDIETGLSVDADFNEPSKRCAGKAGVIKTAIDGEGLTDRLRELFCAAAEASCRTGVPIMVHTEGVASLQELVAFLINLGVSSDKIILCHVDRSTKNMDQKIELLEMGVYFECDTIARPKYHDDISEAAFLYKLAEKGYDNKLLIGLDTTRARLKTYGSSIGLDYILGNFLSTMKAAGFTQQQIDKVCLENPRYALAIRKCG